MATSARRRGMTAAITALFAMALAAAVAGNRRSDGATEAVRAFVAAAQAGDRDKLLGMLGPKTLGRLEKSAERATKLVGGQGRYTARDMIQPMSGDGRGISIVNMGRDGDTASLSITDRFGEKTIVTAVLIGGDWRIELPEEPEP
jgi:hypothetical protein